MGELIETSFYQGSDFIAEEVYDNTLEPEIQFALYFPLEDRVSYNPELKVEDGVIIKPLRGDFVREKGILLPSWVDAYQDDQKLLSEVEDFINHYLDLPHPFYLKLVSHYIFLTWVYDKNSVIPYLRALGDYGSGKTRFVQVIGSLCYKPLFLAGATSDAFIFRMIEQFKGTMVINELERLNTDLSSQLTIILNNGYEKGLFVGRVEGEKKKELKTFDVFCPKIITSRQKFKDLALESRIISIPLRPTKRTDIPSLLGDGFYQDAEKIRNKLLWYRFKNLGDILQENRENEFTEEEKQTFFKLEPRLRQTLIPLYKVIQSEEVKVNFFKYALDFQEQLLTDRNFEPDGLIAEKLTYLLESNENVSIKELTDEVNKELDEKEHLSYKSVGSRVRSFGFKTIKVTGVFRIVHNTKLTESLRDQYGLDKGDVISPLSQLSPLPDSDSIGDLVDIVDITKDTGGFNDSK